MTKEIKDIAIVTKKILPPLVEQALALSITSSKDMLNATKALSELNVWLDTVQDDRKDITAPIKESVKKIEAKYKPAETMLKEAIDHLRNEASSYQTEQTRLAQVEADRIAARVKEGKGNLTLETAVKKIEEIDTPEKKVSTDAGSLTFKATPTLKIISPREVIAWATRNANISFIDINESALLSVLKSGTKVDGAEIQIIQTPINRR